MTELLTELMGYGIWLCMDDQWDNPEYYGRIDSVIDAIDAIDPNYDRIDIAGC